MADAPSTPFPPDPPTRWSRLLLAATLAAFCPPLAAQPFRDVAPLLGLDVEHSLGAICELHPISNGSAWADFDGDGDLDFYLPENGAANHLYANLGDSDGDGLPEYEDVAATAGVAAADRFSFGAVFVDYDDDGDQDLYVHDFAGNRLYENRLVPAGEAVFVDVSEASGLDVEARTIGSAWADFDGDGLLDVYVTRHELCVGADPAHNADFLFHNRGDGTFADVTAEWLCGGVEGTCPTELGLGFSAGWLDYDDDGDLDLYVVNDNILQEWHGNVLWRNDGPDGAGGWLFTDVSVASGTDVSRNPMGLGIGDFDNDGNLDLAFSNIKDSYLLRNRGDGTFADVSEEAGIQRPEAPGGHRAITWGTAFLDFDNDTDLDLFFVGGYIAEPPFSQPNAFFVNRGDGTFADRSVESGLDDPGRGRALSLTDFDGDGAMDLMVLDWGGGVRLFRNRARELGLAGGFLEVRLAGTESNRDAIGSRVVATTSGWRQVRELRSGASHGGGDERILHFGLGAAPEVDLAVRWPNNAVDVVRGVAADRVVDLVQTGFVLGDPDPGRAGEPNAIPVRGAEPGARLALMASRDAGRHRLPGCGPVAAALDAPARLATATADPAGDATFVYAPPPEAAGRPVHLQAVDPVSCRVSARLRTVFE